MAFQRKKPAAIGVKAPYPGFIEPELATSVDRVPSGARWIHEIKFDGYRVQVHLRDAAVKVFTRRGNDWTNRFRKISSDAWHVNASSAIIDGEVVVPADDGATDFSVLQNELKGESNQDRDGRVRLALSQRTRPAGPATARAEGRFKKDHRRYGCPVQ
jgi:bifunctional non-homologous end joining protein LigD